MNLRKDHYRCFYASKLSSSPEWPFSRFGRASPRPASRSLRRTRLPRGSGLPSGRSADWRRASAPCTLGRPRIQVAKGSPAPLVRREDVRVRVGRWRHRSARSNESRARGRRVRDRLDSSPHFFFLFSPTPLSSREGSRHPSSHPRDKLNSEKEITADGGSLGSRVDEERSQLRESM